MKLNQLIDNESSRDIQSIMLDSREKQANSIFFCLEGLSHDAHGFVQQAIENGAVAIVHRHDDIYRDDAVVYHQVNDVMSTLHDVSNRFYDYPSQKLTMIGITGTNGKSTVMKTVRNILLRFGVNAGYIGTISVEYGDKVLAPSLTTPDIVELNAYLKDMVDSGVSDVCLEVSSQGLALRRVEGIEFDSASFTNLSHDHLDYHKTMEDYFAAKEILFDSLKKDAPFYINQDDPYGKRLLNKHAQRSVTYGLQGDADYRAKDIELYSDKTEFILVHKGIEYPVVTNFVAMFNVYNCLNVIAILHGQGYALESIIAQLVDIEHVDGRLTRIEEGQDFDVYVDFGHAPDSMEKVYQFVRSTLPKEGRLITVFGAAGARDHLKRPIMGKVSSQNCDWVILTEHDNRNEKVIDITQDIISGMPEDNYEFVPIRIDAITKALSMAKSGDAVVLIGKGEEKFIYREFGKEEWMGDDEAARKVLRRMK
ncbi:UDP-N-acetylmuramoyl-L-alanyl-D-glutamate--2, 6-diaminopimelate ligase [Erysipelothrix urinaevulpis]|uniref:UDP-N-acetylmuramoyl-L-alanyl-D-glutamate--2, 6-diaminopimelate ligase n=1 Tax=Erysipelothrix urinaevulpis TaxID=2683717 RepID=UPI001359851E|nr:UDP-N-acetylmuramoyl-L-alanyl-D-glutamate--2,6-diaminopimelate ligase [Erysipelothrix urinaevulpis]